MSTGFKISDKNTPLTLDKDSKCFNESDILGEDLDQKFFIPPSVVNVSDKILGEKFLLGKTGKIDLTKNKPLVTWNEKEQYFIGPAGPISDVGYLIRYINNPTNLGKFLTSNTKQIYPYYKKQVTNLVKENNVWRENRQQCNTQNRYCTDKYLPYFYYKLKDTNGIDNIKNDCNKMLLFDFSKFNTTLKCTDINVVEVSSNLLMNILSDGSCRCLIKKMINFVIQAPGGNGGNGDGSAIGGGGNGGGGGAYCDFLVNAYNKTVLIYINKGDIIVYVWTPEVLGSYCIFVSKGQNGRNGTLAQDGDDVKPGGNGGGSGGTIMISNLTEDSKPIYYGTGNIGWISKTILDTRRSYWSNWDIDDLCMLSVVPGGTGGRPGISGGGTKYPQNGSSVTCGSIGHIFSGDDTIKNKPSSHSGGSVNHSIVDIWGLRCGGGGGASASGNGNDCTYMSGYKLITKNNGAGGEGGCASQQGTPGANGFIQIIV